MIYRTRIPLMTRYRTEHQKENMIKWIAALRSGEWHQANAALMERVNNQEAFCCLGVACRIAGCVPAHEKDSKYISEANGDHLSMNLISPEGITMSGMPHASYFQLEFGFDHGMFVVEDGDKMPYSLPSLNDYARFTFSQIADVLESAFVNQEPITLEIP